ncbi:hypothetical protein N7456_004144 [Penicillium angulare]|uniref:Uncharacterized protein n=1 Tax=Penicillium angulare TaxID=116970 RepID=A0A9W9FW11_9EURO|nr:hypothetical protein N7456_004144 [Penicillium angulare]
MFCHCLRACLCGGNRSPLSSGGEEPLIKDPPKSKDWLQSRGAQVIRWIENPADPDCPISRNSLTVEQLQNEARIEDPKDDCMVSDLEFPAGFRLLEPWTTCRVYFGEDLWIGHVTPGVIVMQTIQRMAHETPNISEIALTIYYREYDTTEDLRHIFFTTVMNEQTRELITEDLYPYWPDDAPTMTWEHGTPEYEQIIGTRIGRVAGYIVLGGFDRGTRRIACVVGSSPCEEILDLRFDIEPM